MCIRDRLSDRSRKPRRLSTEAYGTSPKAEENPIHWYAWDAIGTALGSLRTTRTFTYEYGWNRQSGELDEDYTFSLPPAGPALVLCDCIYLLHSPVRRWFDATVYVDAPFELTIERGRERSMDAARISYMERLHRTYSKPYFSKYSSSADWVYRPELENS